MLDKIDELLKEVQGFTSTNKDEIEQFRIKFNGKKGILNDFFEKFKKFNFVKGFFDWLTVIVIEKRSINSTQTHNFLIGIGNFIKFIVSRK